MEKYTLASAMEGEGPGGSGGSVGVGTGPVEERPTPFQDTVSSIDGAEVGDGAQGLGEE